MNKLVSIVFAMMVFCVLASCCVTDTPKTSMDPIVGTWKLEKPMTIEGIGQISNPAYTFTVNYTTTYPDYRVTFYENHSVISILGDKKVVYDNASYNGSHFSNYAYISQDINTTWTNLGDGKYLITYYNKKTKKSETETIPFDNDSIVFFAGHGKYVRA